VNRRRAVALALAAGLLAGCAEGWERTGRLTLAERGRAPDYTIVLPDGPSPSQAFAAAELRKYVARMTGVSLPIATNVTPDRAVFLGNGSDDLGSDGFRLRSTPPHFRIEGGRVHGTLFGVYDFLERYCGCGWFSPTTSDIPVRDRLSVSATLDDVQKPAFRLRDTNWTDQLADWTYTATLKLNGFRTAYPEALGGQDHRKDTTTGGATFDSLCPPSKYFRDHPDWFALIDGKRCEHGQRCLTNRGFLDFLVRQTKDRIRRNYPRCKYYSINPNDFRRNCQCADCRAMDDRGGSPSASLVHMANTVAEAVAADHPDVTIITFAYSYTLKPPTGLKVHPNVMICYCTDNCDFSKPIVESRWRGCRDFIRDFRGWGALTDRIYIWDYSANFRYLFQPFECCHVLPENFRLFREHGAVGVFEEGDHYGYRCVDEALKTWLIGHLLWDPDQPLDPLLDRFFRGYYGAAASTGRGYYDALVELERKRDETKEPLVMMGTLLQDGYQPRAFFDEWSEKWTAALELVKDDPVRRENVYWARQNVDTVRIVRAPCAVRYSLAACDPDRERRERAELRQVARRILADYARLDARGATKPYGFNMQVRERVRAVANLDPSAADVGTGRFAVPADDLRVSANMATTRVKDPLARDGKAIRIGAEARDGTHHCLSFREESFLRDTGVKIGIRVHARVECTGETKGTAFSVGTCDRRTFSKRDIGCWELPIRQVTGDGYAWYEVGGTWCPAGDEVLWVGNGRRVGERNPCIKAVYVDQIELFRKDGCP